LAIHWPVSGRSGWRQLIVRFQTGGPPSPPGSAMPSGMCFSSSLCMNKGG
jgi:hypothetical protein